MKKEVLKLEYVCKVCSNSAPIDEQHSNENWRVVANVKDGCRCGGKYQLKVS